MQKLVFVPYPLRTGRLLLPQLRPGAGVGCMGGGGGGYHLSPISGLPLVLLRPNTVPPVPENSHARPGLL